MQKAFYSETLRMMSATKTQIPYNEFVHKMDITYKKSSYNNKVDNSSPENPSSLWPTPAYSYDGTNRNIHSSITNCYQECYETLS